MVILNLAKFQSLYLRYQYGPRPALAELIERKLFDRGYLVAIVDSERAAHVLQSVGLIAILSAAQEVSLPADEEEAATQLIHLLERDGRLLAGNAAERKEMR